MFAKVTTAKVLTEKVTLAKETPEAVPVKATPLKTKPSKTCDSVGNQKKPPQSVRLPLTHERKPTRDPAPVAIKKLDAKLRGEIVEMMFMLQASLRALIVAKPYGDSRRYDFITDAGRLWRVQVKGTARRSGNGFIVNATHRRHSRQVYTAAEIDFLITYVIPRNIWYIIPVTGLRGPTFNVYPDGCRRGAPYGPYEKYREAWHLIDAAEIIPEFGTSQPASLPCRRDT